jgi:putative DNA primase/helicase
VTEGIFDAAKSRILSDLEHYFPDGESRNGEWWWRRRDGDKTPSCHAVGDTAAVKDFGDDGFRGSVLDCYAELHGMSALDAAKEICPEQAKRPSKAPSKEKEKAKAVYPVPEGKEKLLNVLINSQWAKEKYGDAVMGSKYTDEQGRLIFTVIRFENSPAKHGGKDFRPFYFGDDGKWYQGDPFPNGLPLYGLHDLAQRPTAPVLVVEGEKCQAAAEKALPEYVRVTWSHGSSSVDKTDWAPLAGRDVTIWPDADAPGLKAAIAIRNRLPGARILDVGGEA